LKGSSAAHLVQQPAQNRDIFDNAGQIGQNLSKRVLNILKDKASTTSPGCLFQDLLTLTVKIFFNTCVRISFATSVEVLQIPPFKTSSLALKSCFRSLFTLSLISQELFQNFWSPKY